MKQFLAIILAAMLLFSVTACSSGGGSGAADSITLTPGKLSVAISPDFARAARAFLEQSQAETIRAFTR